MCAAAVDAGEGGAGMGMGAGMGAGGSAGCERRRLRGNNTLMQHPTVGRSIPCLKMWWMDTSGKLLQPDFEYTTFMNWSYDVYPYYYPTTEAWYTDTLAIVSVPLFQNLLNSSSQAPSRHLRRGRS